MYVNGAKLVKWDALAKKAALFFMSFCGIGLVWGNRCVNLCDFCFIFGLGRVSFK